MEQRTSKLQQRRTAEEVIVPIQGIAAAQGRRQMADARDMGARIAGDQQTGCQDGVPQPNQQHGSDKIEPTRMFAREQPGQRAIPKPEG